MDDHPHRHVNTTACEDGECGTKHEESYVHAHENGHEWHGHRPDGMRLIKVEDDAREIMPKTSEDGLFNA